MNNYCLHDPRPRAFPLIDVITSGDDNNIVALDMPRNSRIIIDLSTTTKNVLSTLKILIGDELARRNQKETS